MTAIGGMVMDGGVLLGADSLAVGGSNKEVRKDPKLVSMNSEYAFGFTASYRFGQIVRYHVEPPSAIEGEDLFDTFVREWIPLLRTALKDHGNAKVDNNVEQGGCMLVAWRDRLFTIYSDFSVAEVDGGIAATGCGEEYLLGALSALRDHTDLTPKKMMLAALHTAATWSTGVGAPFLTATTRIR